MTAETTVLIPLIRPSLEDIHPSTENKTTKFSTLMKDELKEYSYLKEDYAQEIKKFD